MSTYLCYDIRGIQQSIFAVPRLKYIVGGSSLIDAFDREGVDKIAKGTGAEKIFAGGGRGTFFCKDAGCAANLSRQIRDGIHRIGLEARIGQGASPVEAAQNFVTFALPMENLSGEPCAVSGLFPVDAGAKGAAGASIHPFMRIRAEHAGTDRVGREILGLASREPDFPAELRDLFQSNRDSVVFMRSVNPDIDDDAQSQQIARRGQIALGSRNRWALIAMDGNNIGMQHQAAKERYRGDADAHRGWLLAMSGAIDRSARSAVASALAGAVSAWWQTAGRSQSGSAPVVLPFRPLIAGGDDVLLLSHCSYAMDIVKCVCRKFSEFAGKESAAFGGGGLWLATAGQLTISAGVLYLPVTFPIASAIAYTESLLGSAKGRSRQVPAGTAAPASVDWESITEGAIDSPAERRNRELRFLDGDDPETEVILTYRPWLVSELCQHLDPLKDRLADLPVSIRHELLPILRQGCWERMRGLARIRKNYSRIFDDLNYRPGAACGPGWKKESRETGGFTLRTCYNDALLLLAEEHRMKQRTAK